MTEGSAKNLSRVELTPADGYRRFFLPGMDSPETLKREWQTMRQAFRSAECSIYVPRSPEDNFDTEALSQVFHDGNLVGLIIEEYSAELNEINFYPIGEALPEWIIDLYTGEANPSIPGNHGYTFR